MFPKNVFAFILTVFLSIIPGIPIILLMQNDLENQNVYINLNFLIFLLTFVGIVHYKNKVRKIKISYNFKPLKLSFLLFTILIIWISRLIIIIVNHLVLEKQDFNYDVYAILGALIIAPILEEIIFRNILLNSLLNSNTRNKAILISSVVFAVIHIQPLYILNAMFAGLFLGLVYSKNKNIGHTIILHFFANFFSLFTQYFIVKYSTNQYSIFVFCFVTIISMALLYFMNKKYNYSILKMIREN